MICKRCGKDEIGTDKCLYCGMILRGFIPTDRSTNRDARDTVTDFEVSAFSCDVNEQKGIESGDPPSPETLLARHKATNPHERRSKTFIKLGIAYFIFAGLFLLGWALLCAAGVLGEDSLDILLDWMGLDFHDSVAEIMATLMTRSFLFFGAGPLISVFLSRRQCAMSVRDFAEELREARVNAKQWAMDHCLRSPRDGRLMTVTTVTATRTATDLKLDRRSMQEGSFILDALCVMEEPTYMVAVQSYPGKSILFSIWLFLGFALGNVTGVQAGEIKNC